MATCPNINLPQWKELVASRGENMAYFLWDTYNGEVPQSESRQAILRASIKSIDILSSQKAKQVFAKGEKNNWSLDKTLTELQVPKDQKEIILDKGITDREEIITSLLAENSFIVEVNTAKISYSGSNEDIVDNQKPFTYKGNEYLAEIKLGYDGGIYVNRYLKNDKEITSEEFDKIYDEYKKSEEYIDTNNYQPTDYYSNLTVPGGTNYTENEITTPDITPNIKGHAQFSTDKGIGWFRSDEQIIGATTASDIGFSSRLFSPNEIMGNTGTNANTRRILEVQSDLFQKSRDTKDLVTRQSHSQSVQIPSSEFNNEKAKPLGDSGQVVGYFEGRTEYYQFIDTKESFKRIPKDIDSKENKFLQLLNKKNNWVTFFVKSIIQDSAKKGYERVLFPKGDTAAKIEGHQTLEEFKKQKEDRIEELKKELELINNNDRVTKLPSGFSLKNTTLSLEEIRDKNNRETERLKQELSDVESGQTQLSSISNFYENNITNILKKNGYNPVEIKDEYDNTWNEVLIAPAQANETILFQRQTEQPTTKASSEILNKVKEVIKKMGVDVQPLTDYARQNPAIDESSVNAVADLTAGVIAIAEGKEDVALTEEMVHIATAIIEQKNPELVTEMISKIGRFKIYKDTLEAYKDLPAYQLENGKPNIRKIKKEAVDKMITSIILGDTSLEEADQSIFRRMWDMITDWFRGQYKKANIDIFSTTAETVIGGEFEGSIVDLDSKEIYYQVTDKQKDFQRKVEETRGSLRKIETNEKADPLLLDEEKATSYYELLVNGKYERITKRVTDRVKAWYKSRFGTDGFTAQQDRDNEVKRVLGTQYHEYFEEAHARFFNEDGTRRENPGPRPNIQGSLNNDVYNKLETYYTDLIASFSENGKNPLVFSELQVYDSKNKEAGTIDLLIVEQDGTANIYDWKFMSVAKGAEDVAWFKQGAYDIQLGTYKKILLDNYGVKKVGKNRAVPIIMDLKRDNFQDPTSKLEIKGIKIGSVNPTQIEPLTLTPVSEKSESTGVEAFDELIEDLNAIQSQISATKANSDDEREFKSERLNIINKAIRSLQTQQRINPLIDSIGIMQRAGENIIAKYKTSYEGRPADDKDLTDVELSEFSAELREYIAFSNIFGGIADRIGDYVYNDTLEEQSLTDEEKVEVANRKEMLKNLTDQSTSIRKSGRKIEKIAGEFTEKFIGERNLVTGFMKPERIVKGLSSLFRGTSEIGLKALDILYKLANRAMGFAQEDALNEVNELLEIKEKLEARGGDLKKLVQGIYQKDKKGAIANKLIYKYQRKFFDEVDANAEEGRRSRKWLKENVDLEAYAKEAKPILKEAIRRINERHEDPELKEKLILQEYQKWDTSRPDFRGYNNYVIKRHPLEKWESQEYINLKKDPELFSLYTFISGINKKAKDVGYIDNAAQSTFLPFVRKSMAESLAWDGSLGSISNFQSNFNVELDTVGYGNINQVTGELENSIPKYYTTDFSRQEDGTNDYSDVSLDLFKNMIMYINHMEKYKYLSSIEDQLLLVKTAEQFKKHLKTSSFSKAVSKDGKLVDQKGNSNNIEIIDQFFRNVLYGQKYALDDSDVEVPIVGSVTRGVTKAINAVSRSVTGQDAVKEGSKQTTGSLIKTMDFLNRYVQVKALGFKSISGLANYFGGNLQLAALAGKYFDYREIARYQARLFGNRFKNDDERKMFVQLIDKFMPLKDDPTYDKMVSAGMSKLTDKNYSDILFVWFRQTEQHLEKSVFMALLDNMMVEDGKLVNIRDFVKNKYKNRYTSAEEYNSVKGKIKEEIAELKKTRSINATKKLEDGKLVVPGLDLSNREELQRLTNVARTLSRTATGGATEFDNIRANMNVWLRSLMVFKGWIPKLALTRFGEFRKVADDFSVEIGEDGLTTGEKYDIGRIRLFSDFLHFNILRSVKEITDVLTVSEDGISKIDELFDKYTRDYEQRFGEPLNMTKEDFADMIRLNLRNQVRELALLASLLGMALALGWMAPDDDKDRATKNKFRYFQKVVDKFISEVSFFYNPAEMASTLSGGMPAIGLFQDFGRATNHFFRETTGIDLSDPTKSAEQVRKEAQPIKNVMKLFPVSNSIIPLLASFDEEFAKEFDITISKTAR